MEAIESKSVTIYSMLTWVLGSHTYHEIKLSVPVDDSGKGGFGLTLNPNTEVYNFSLKFWTQHNKIMFYKMKLFKIIGIVQATTT